jgi:1,4-alpha-glucan branching enzyme
MYKKNDKSDAMYFGFKPAGQVQKVHLAGDFTGWKPVAMKKRRDGSYAAEVSLSKGIYQYKFVVDGRWLTDPDHSHVAPNSLGTFNSIVQV